MNNQFKVVGISHTWCSRDAFNMLVIHQWSGKIAGF